jgi:hypothetical protein
MVEMIEKHEAARAPSVKEKGPCHLCGRTDPHSHTSGPGGMS